jgi:hypothetical protein
MIRRRCWALTIAGEAKTMTQATPATEPRTSGHEIAAIAAETYIYLYPLVLMEITRRQLTSQAAGTKPGVGPMGRFSHIREFPPGDFRDVVRPNYDTLYSSAWLDLRGGPVTVSVPDTRGRYYLLPMLDMWTDVFAAPGKRTTGTAAASYAVLPPGWRGGISADTVPIQAPTSYAWVIGRTQTNGPADYPSVGRVQDGLSITPSGHWNPVPAPREQAADTETPPAEQVAAMSGGQFFGLAAELFELHPPHPTDWSVLARAERLGLRPGQPFGYAALDAATRNAVEGAPAEALRLMNDALPRMGRIVNGWLMNTDSVGVYGNNYLKRAIVALAGLGANQPEDAVYPLNMADASGEPVDGGNEYVLHFAKDELPPVAAFWSVTMYDPEGYPVPNPADRYAIGDRDNLRYSSNGSLDLYIQHDNPGPDREANWLPAPFGSPLGTTMRLYAPAPEVIDGRWNPPPITRTR